jgi:precorrin-6B methylase 2
MVSPSTSSRLVVSLTLLLAGCGGFVQDAIISYQDKKRCEDFTIKRYLRPDNEERRASREVAMVLEALGELDGLAVADVGAGAGFFTYMLAEMVGPEGKVLATEQGMCLVPIIEQGATERGLGNIEVLHVKAVDAVGLPDASVDLILAVNLGSFEGEEPMSYPGGLTNTDWMLRQLHSGLKPGGRLLLTQNYLNRSERIVPDGHPGPCKGNCEDMAPEEVAGRALGLFTVDRLQRIEREPVAGEHDVIGPGYLLELRKPL